MVRQTLGSKLSHTERGQLRSSAYCIYLLQSVLVCAPSDGRIHRQKQAWGMILRQQ
jgi:hypothetical protein